VIVSAIIEVAAWAVKERDMRRLLAAGTLIGIGALSLAASGQAPPAGPSAKALAAARIEKVKDNLYVVTGSDAQDQSSFSGGNTAVFITDAGVTLVDTKLAGWGPTLLARIKTVTDKPITRIINTHTHGDHTGSNEFFGATIESVVQENTRANMAKMDEFKGAKAQFLPTKTYKDKLTLGSGKDQIDLYYFGRGHTNGDSFVVFPAVRTMHVGDIFAWKALPYVDASNGGSVVEQPKTLARAVATVKNVDTIINGHIPVSTWNDLKEYADFTQEFVAYAESSMKAGKTVEQAAADYKVAPTHKGYIVTIDASFAGPKSNLQIAYDELKKK
jgi:glyoxylase-like metal-dependent hydrolase (beta-lactamase superfamily II)